MGKRLVFLLKQAKAQVEATQKLLRYNQQALHAAQVVVKQIKHEARAAKRVADVCKRLRTRRSTCQHHKSKPAK